MPTFPPVEMAIAWPPDRQARRRLLTIVGNDGSHNYPNCWGFTIFRTVYTPGSDEAFAKAMERLDVYAKYTADEELPPHTKRRLNEPPLDPLPNQVLWSHYYNEVVEDPETLANAGVEEVGRRFDAWIAENWIAKNHDISPSPTRRSPPNSRYQMCIMLDQEGIDNILAMPEDPNTDARDDPQIDERWVSVITDEEKPEGGRLWFRAGIRENLWQAWFEAQDPDIYFYECGWLSVDGVLNYRDFQGVPHHHLGGPVTEMYLQTMGWPLSRILPKTGNDLPLGLQPQIWQPHDRSDAWIASQISRLD